VARTRKVDTGMEQERSIEGALERGATALTRWARDGTLIAPRQLAKAWGQDLHTLQAAVRRGDLFEVWVDEIPYCSALFVGLGVEATAKVCQALGGMTASEKLVFLMREHGALSGQTVIQALSTGTPMARIEELASDNAAGF